MLLLLHDRLPSSSDKQHQCVYCAQSFKSKGELDRHVKVTHVMPTTSQKCNICDEVFPSAAVLAQHKLTHCKVNVANVPVFCSHGFIVNKSSAVADMLPEPV